MTLKLSKTALRELRALYRAVLMAFVGAGFFIASSASATETVENISGTEITIYSQSETDDLLNGKQDKLTDGSIDTTLLADDAVTADKIADDAVTADKIEKNAVGQYHIANGSVGTAEIIDSSITKAKLDTNLQASIDQVDTNKTAIETLNGDVNTVGSVANAVSTKQDKLSDAQMNAVNSGITADKVAKYEAYDAKIDAKANADKVYTKDTIDAKLENIDKNKADATAVSANTENITNNSKAIEKNEAAINKNVSDIATLQTGKADATDVEANKIKIENNANAIDKLNGDKNTNGSVANTVNTAVNELADGAVKENTEAIDILNGTGDGSVAKTVADAVNGLADGAVKENTDKIDQNTQAIATNKTALDVLNGDVNKDGSVANIASGYAKTAETNAKTYAKSYTDTLIGSTDDLVEQNGVMELGTVNNNISALNKTIGNITNLNQYTEGSAIGNALTQGGTQSANTVVAALNNIDATLGTIHGLRDKLATSGGGTNLASGTTVEQHLTALDSAIGNRSYTSTRYISSGSDLSSAVSTLDSNLSRVEGNLDALTRRTQKMHHEMKSGFASLAAMSALVPNARVAGDTQISVGTGHYRGTTGFALGAFHHVNDNILLNAGAAYGGNGSATFKGGLTFGW